MTLNLDELDFDELELDEKNLKFTVMGQVSDEGRVAVSNHRDIDATRYLNICLLSAIKLGVSDIHFEPYGDYFRIRYRVDGILQDRDAMAKSFGNLLTTRLKVVAGLDIAEQRITQGGRFTLQLSLNESMDFRCSITPTMHGETCVLRLLYLPDDILSFDALGLSDKQVEPIQAAINRQQGMVLITGPTGSGKTVTLYTLIKYLQQKRLSIYTVEDPIEIDVSGVNQVSVAERFSFAEASRSLLRQDPDVIMLGEMRDETTIDTAIKAAHTGHLVLSTLHATTAAKVIPRLRNLGVPAYDIASIVSLVISQRLLRRLDPKTKEAVAVPHARLLTLGFKKEELKDLRLYRAKPKNKEEESLDVDEQNEARHVLGASMYQSGYKGRVGVFQVMPITPALAQLITNGATDIEIDVHIQKQGIEGLRASALDKVRQGVTDIDELERVLGVVN